MTSPTRAVVALLGVLLAFSSLAHAQQTTAVTEPGPAHVYVFANATLREPAEGSFTSAAPYTGTSFTYRVSRLFGGDVGGGYLVQPFIGFGVAVSHAWSDGNPSVQGQEGATPLKRSETAVHVQVAVRPKTSENSQLLLYAGPTYYTVNQELITDVYQNAYYFSQNSATAWGYNVGADFAVFIHRNAGLGITFRYARANVQMVDSAAAMVGEEGTQPVTAGGFLYGFGVRLRF
jgi:hypothetical protein